MLQYETVFIADPTYTDEEVDELIKGYEQVVTAAGGRSVRFPSASTARLSRGRRVPPKKPARSNARSRASKAGT